MLAVPFKGISFHDKEPIRICLRDRAFSVPVRSFGEGAGAFGAAVRGIENKGRGFSPLGILAGFTVESRD